VICSIKKIGKKNIHNGKAYLKTNMEIGTRIKFGWSSIFILLIPTNIAFVVNINMVVQNSENTMIPMRISGERIQSNDQ